jgi:heme a synthase
MIALRRLSYVALGVAYLHLVFGAIVRITGSGMGCGDHWPKCLGYWFPPLQRQDLIIEVTHRYLASLLGLAALALVVVSWRMRGTAGVAGPGGVLRAATGGLVAIVATALLGAVTVRFGNPTWATVFHWTFAMTVLALLASAAIRAGALGGTEVRAGSVAPRSMRGSMAAAALALLAVVMGGLTAKVPYGAVACLDFPLCGANPAAPPSAVHTQLTHRIVAVLLLVHSVGLALGVRRRGENPIIVRAARILVGTILLQLLVAGAMIGMHLPASLRSMHEAVGVAIWLSAFTLAYLATRGARRVTAVTPRRDASIPAHPLVESAT